MPPGIASPSNPFGRNGRGHWNGEACGSNVAARAGQVRCYLTAMPIGLVRWSGESSRSA
jgi:hypothetical protein